MRILLLSAYDAASHRQWRCGLSRHLHSHNWTTLTLPDRFFSWRIRGNALSWASEQADVLDAGYDLIVATSMVDLASLKGLAPRLALTPSLLYFHENQFAYPESADQRHGALEAQITSIYAAMAADRLLFNSTHNRDSFVSGARTLLKRLPDHAPAALVDSIAAKSDVLPVPLEMPPLTRRKPGCKQPLQLVWNHRWEYDKGPERLLLLLQELQAHGLDFRIHIIGQQFRRQPPAFASMARDFSERIDRWGYVENRDDYLQILQQSDIVISTALHDFQGLAMQEAMACGCLPVAPNRLAYPEYIPEPFLADSYPDHADKDAAALAATLLSVAASMTETHPPQAPDMHALYWPKMLAKYETALTRAVVQHQRESPQ